MTHQKRLFAIKDFRNILIIILFLLPWSANASFIEATIGTAVVDDATATYFNPAALTLLKNPQIVGLGTMASFRTSFTGQATQTRTRFTQSGTTNTQTQYYLPSIYLGFPVTKNYFFGVAVLSNLFNRDLDSDSVLRYAQSSNSVQDVDFVPAVAIKLNDFISIGGNLNFSYANFLLEPTVGVPSLNIPDNQSRNESEGTAVGGDVGILLKPTSSTLVGLNYRSSLTYKLRGRSILEGNPGIISDNYSFNFWTPARIVLSINQFVDRAKRIGIIGTVQWVQWGIFDEIHIHNIATQIGPRPIIVSEVAVPFHLHNSWIFTLGSNYRVTRKWVVRAAGSYMQSPANGNYQIANGDSIILGASTGYQINKHLVIDGSYAHAFVRSQKINIVGPINTITGVNTGSRDSVSLKVTVNL